MSPSVPYTLSFKMHYNSSHLTCLSTSGLGRATWNTYIHIYHIWISICHITAYISAHSLWSSLSPLCIIFFYSILTSCHSHHGRRAAGEELRSIMAISRSTPGRTRGRNSHHEPVSTGAVCVFRPLKSMVQGVSKGEIGPRDSLWLDRVFS